MEQFTAKERPCEINFPDACREVVHLGEKPIGRLIASRIDEDIRLADMALLPEHRNMGISSSLIGALLDQADEEDLPAKLHASRQNRTVNLYSRPGFLTKETDEICCVTDLLSRYKTIRANTGLSSKARPNLVWLSYGRSISFSYM